MSDNTPSDEELGRAISRYQEAAEDLSKSSEHFRRVVARVNDLSSSALSASVGERLRDVAQQLSAQMIQSESHQALVRSVQEANSAVGLQVIEQARAFQQWVVPQMLPDYSTLMRDLAANKRLTETFGRLARESVRDLELPIVLTTEDFDRFMKPVRAAADMAAARLGVAPARDLVDALHEAEDAVLELRRTPKGEERRHNLVLLVAILACLFTFLANQDKILKQAFEDLALFGHALSDVWQYAVLVLYVIVVGIAQDSDVPS